MQQIEKEAEERKVPVLKSKAFFGGLIVDRASIAGVGDDLQTACCQSHARAC